MITQFSASSLQFLKECREYGDCILDKHSIIVHSSEVMGSQYDSRVTEDGDQPCPGCQTEAEAR